MFAISILRSVVVFFIPVTKMKSLRRTSSSRKHQYMAITNEFSPQLNDKSCHRILPITTPLVISSHTMFNPLTPPPSPPRSRHSIHPIGQHATDFFLTLAHADSQVRNFCLHSCCFFSNSLN